MKTLSCNFSLICSVLGGNDSPRPTHNLFPVMLFTPHFILPLMLRTLTVALVSIVCPDSVLSQELNLPQVGGTYVAPVYPSGNQDTRSFLRVHNVSDMDGEAIVYLFDSMTGSELGKWRQGVPAHASPQYEIKELEEYSGLQAEKDDPYALYVLSSFDGFIQNVVWNAVGGSLTNISNCGRDISEDERLLGNVHTSLLSSYPAQ